MESANLEPFLILCHNSIPPIGTTAAENHHRQQAIPCYVTEFSEIVYLHKSRYVLKRLIILSRD